MRSEEFIKNHVLPFIFFSFAASSVAIPDVVTASESYPVAMAAYEMHRDRNFVRSQDPDD